MKQKAFEKKIQAFLKKVGAPKTALESGIDSRTFGGPFLKFVNKANQIEFAMLKSYLMGSEVVTIAAGHKVTGLDDRRCIKVNDVIRLFSDCQEMLEDINFMLYVIERYVTGQVHALGRRDGFIKRSIEESEKLLANYFARKRPK
ncbi:MAG TPA: hypothetical protein VMC41_02640 [Candidatus Nanoarchaeia archaeon]|nr:hypothetical protein [Candidatus Nanoarchaeia archaeon]